jgi:DNA-binding NtrC family response regulator
MSRVVDLARRAGESDAKILITGESGVGKDVIAREVHACSQRRNRPFIAVNCAGFPETLLETELFGHVRGSFTGADRDRVGKLQLADGGTFFLDEVGEMSLRMQALLLRFLENGRSRRSATASRGSWTCASLPPPTGTCPSASPPASSARTCSTVCASSRSPCRRCASGRRTCRP